MTISKTKFIRVFKTLSEEEIKSFELFSKSPYCNTNKNIIKLVDKIKKFHPHYDSPKLEKEKLFKRILPNGKFSERRMNNILSEAYLALEQFLIFQNLKNDQQLQQNLISKEFQNRHLEEQFSKQTQAQIEKLEKKDVKDWEDHLELLTLNRRVYHHPNLKQESKEEIFEKISTQLDLVFLSEKAEIIVEQTFRNRMLKNENYEFERDLENWQQMVEDKDNLSFKLYQMRFDYSNERFLEQYFDLRKILFERIEELNEREQKVHLTAILNDTMHLARKQLISIPELLPVFKIGLEKGILFHNGELTYKTYCNILVTSNTVGDFQFSRYFTSNYTEKLQLRYQKEAKNWALAHTAYKQDKLTSALDILIENHPKIQFFQFLSRTLTTQVYFELYLQNKDSYHFFLFNYFDSFERWVLREKLESKQMKKSILRFVQITRMMAKDYDDDKFDKIKINKILDNEKSLQAPQWLRAKVQEISKLNKGHSKFE